MSKKSKEDIDWAAEPEWLTEYKSLDEEINKDKEEYKDLQIEDKYRFSRLRPYLELDSWEYFDALLLLCGIDPQGAAIEDGFETHMGAPLDSVKIRAAIFLDGGSYDHPTRDEVGGWIIECKENIKNLQIKKEDIIAEVKSSDDVSKYNKAIRSEEKSLSTYNEWLEDKSFKKTWRIRSIYAGKLARYRRIWESGNHEDRNPLGYYINWALKKGFEISWLEWAKSQGLLSTEATNSFEITNDLGSGNANSENPVTHARPIGAEVSEVNLVEAFDPLPLSNIAKLFPLTGDVEKNLKKWKTFAGKASQNGLIKARVSVSKGRAESTFNPWQVGEWVITQKHGLLQEVVYRKLANNLPPRSKEFKDLILL